MVAAINRIITVFGFKPAKQALLIKMKEAARGHVAVTDRTFYCSFIDRFPGGIRLQGIYRQDHGFSQDRYQFRLVHFSAIVFRKR